MGVLRSCRRCISPSSWATRLDPGKELRRALRPALRLHIHPASASGPPPRAAPGCRSGIRAQTPQAPAIRRPPGFSPRAVPFRPARCDHAPGWPPSLGRRIRSPGTLRGTLSPSRSPHPKVPGMHAELGPYRECSPSGPPTARPRLETNHRGPAPVGIKDVRDLSGVVSPPPRRPHGLCLYPLGRDIPCGVGAPAAPPAPQKIDLHPPPPLPTRATAGTSLSTATFVHRTRRGPLAAVQSHSPCGRRRWGACSRGSTPGVGCRSF